MLFGVKIGGVAVGVTFWSVTGVGERGPACVDCAVAEGLAAVPEPGCV